MKKYTLVKKLLVGSNVHKNKENMLLILVYVKIKNVYYTCSYLSFNALNQKGDYKVIVIPSSLFFIYISAGDTKKRKCDFFIDTTHGQ